MRKGDKGKKVLGLILIVIVILVFLGTIFSGVVAATTYDPQAAVNYADTWWNGRNPNYYDYSNEGGDSANFASQCLIAGGLDLSEHPGADSWGCIPSCTNLHDYLVNYLGATYETMPKSQVEPIWFVPGDPAIFPTPKHAVFAVTGDATHYATCNAHSTDRDHRTIQWFFDNSNCNSCTYYHIPTDIPTPPALPTITSPGSSSGPGPTIDTLTPTVQWNSVSNSNADKYLYDMGIATGQSVGYYEPYQTQLDSKLHNIEVPNQQPPAIIDSITPDPAEQGTDTVSFTGHGTDPDGTVEAYNWSSSIDGPLSTSAAFTKPASELSVGTHTIYFKVHDDDGTWSTEDTADLTIYPANIAPTAIIDSITPDPAEQGTDTVSFTGHGTDPDGTVEAYNWSSSIDGQLSTSAAFTKPASELSVGTHTIYFKVQDNDGAWSTEDTEDLTIYPANIAPTAIIDSITPDPAEQGTDTVSFTGQGTDPDGTVEAYNWSSSMDGPLSTSAAFTKPASELSVGTHTIYFKVQDNDGAWSTEDTEDLTINPGPELSYSPESHDFGDMREGETDSTTFEIWNSGTDTLTYSLSETCDWLEVHPTSGSSTGEHNTITVDMDTTGLFEGSHTCDITISSNDGSGTFTVMVNVVPCPESSWRYKVCSWTYMVYLDGDNNLEGAAIDDFMEMSSVGSTSDVNIVVQFDRIPGYDTSYGDWTDCKRFRVTSGMTPTPANALIINLGECNMGHPNTLREFVEWTMTNFPADNYALILWNHGDGWKSIDKWVPWADDLKDAKDAGLTRGICVDNTNNDYLSLQETEVALTGKYVQLLGYDACLMHMIEVVYQVMANAGVSVGSEEVEPWDGWPYNTILADLTGMPTMNEDALGTVIVDRYMDSYGYTGSETQSAMDNSALPNLGTAVDNLAQALINEINGGHVAEVQQARNAAEEIYYTYYIDLYHFAEKIQLYVPGAAIQAQAVMNEVSKMYEAHGTSVPNDHGLSIYFPRVEGHYLPSYDNTAFASDTEWNEFLKKYYAPTICGNMGVNPTTWSTTLNCGESDNEIVTVSATGGTVKGVTVSKISGPTWLSVSPTDLGDIASGSSKTFTITASPPSETSGDFGYTVRVSNTCGTPSTRDVTGTITVWCPELSYSPASHDFGDKCEGEKDSTTFEIWNSGTGTLTYSLSEACGWLEVNPTSGSSTGEHDTITVDIDTTGLSEGLHTCDISIGSNDGSGTFTVTINVVPCEEPVLSYLPTSHDFGDMCEGVMGSTTFEIWNSGTGTLTYTLSESCGWVDVNPASGFSTGEHDTITVDIDTTELSEGLHTCDISIGSNDGSGTFTVTINVVPCEEPVLSYSPTSHDFGDMCEGETDSTTFEIWNSETGTLTYTLSESCGWLDVNPAGGSSTGEHDTITVEIDTTGLSEGPHACDISISSNGGSGTFTVTVNVVPCEEPVLSYLPTSHDFGDMCEGVTDSTTFEIWNSGTGTLTYTLSESCGWLGVNPTSGSSTGEYDTITVEIDTTGLSEGPHTCDISISSNGGSGTFTVTVNVVPCPETVVSIEDASAPQGGTVTVPIKIVDVENMCGANIWLHYNKDVVIVDSVSDGDLVPLTHNIDNPAGVTKMTWDTTSGMTGDFVFAYVTLKAVGNPGDTCLLDLDVKELYDCNLVEIPRTVVDGTFEVIPPLMEGDVTDLNVCVSLKDSTLIKFYLVDMATLTPDQLECADTNDDGEVTLKDSTAIKFWLVDQDFPLWQSPADDHMMEPVPCSVMPLARAASTTDSIEDASMPAKCSLLFVAGGEPIEKKKACSCYPQKEMTGGQEKLGGNMK